MAYALTKYEVAELKPAMLLEKVPGPEPSVVLVVSAIVGAVVVLQTTPRAVTVAPPMFVIFPPLWAVVVVIALISAVVSVGVDNA